jgi:hypothetical protein
MNAPIRILDAVLAGVPIVEATELAAIEETLAMAEDPTHWPHAAGATPSPAHIWREHEFDDTDVERWLEVGVHSASAAAELRDAEVDRQRLLVEWIDGVTYGRAFADGDVSLMEVCDG